MVNKDIIVYNINKLVDDSNLSRGAFADMVGISRSNFSKILNGNYPCGEGVINKIVLATGVNKEWIKTGCGDMYNVQENIIRQSTNQIEMPSVPTLDVKEEGGAVIPSLLSIIKDQGEALKDIALNNDKQRLEEQVHLLNEIQGLKEALESQQKAFKIFCQKLDDLISQSNLPKQKKVS